MFDSYDAKTGMEAFDALPRRIRDVVNEVGFATDDMAAIYFDYQINGESFVLSRMKAIQHIEQQEYRRQLAEGTWYS